VESDGDWMRAEVDMSRYPGKILAFLPEEIAAVQLSTSAEVEAGGALAYRVAVCGKSGQEIDAAFPLEISLVDSGNQEVQAIFRTAAPEYRGAYRVAVNAR
ncbi:MAG: hypothetical protein N3A66_01440, partial [Planctomycetota bacterium]|nr:hypothetical protein [Planctomycetota bacterium]